MDFRNESFEHERAEDHDSGNSSHSDQEVSVAASIGIALIDSAHDRPEDLLREADSAMYEAKNNEQP